MVNNEKTILENLQPVSADASTILDGEKASAPVATVGENGSVSLNVSEYEKAANEINGATDRHILSIPLDDYTITEGLLLGIFLVLVGSAVLKLFFKIFNF